MNHSCGSEAVWGYMLGGRFWYPSMDSAPKSHMAEMREKALSHEALDDCTLFIAWMSPMPLRILKCRRLLAATRNMLKFRYSSICHRPPDKGQFICLTFLDSSPFSFWI